MDWDAYVAGRQYVILTDAWNKAKTREERSELWGRLAPHLEAGQDFPSFWAGWNSICGKYGMVPL